jgi:hypothetical protein
VATRQTSSSGRPKSPRIQVVLPEELCERLAALAQEDSRTVSNMAKVLIQEGVEARERQGRPSPQKRQHQPERIEQTQRIEQTEQFREVLERQEQARPSRLRGAPRRLRLQRPPKR